VYYCVSVDSDGLGRWLRNALQEVRVVATNAAGLSRF